MDIIHNLELQRMRVQAEGRLSVAMQRMVLESAEEGRLKTQVEERREDIRRVREEKEEEWDKE
jgi:hypothetical protein